MPFSFDVEKLSRFVAERWERRSTIVFLLLLIAAAGIYKFTDSDLADLSFAELGFLLFLCMLALLLWLRSVRIPRARRGRVGFAVAIDCETKELERTIIADLISSLRRLLNQHSLRHKFDLVLIPKSHAVRICDLDSANHTRAIARCHFLMYGTAKIREISGKKKHVLNLDFQVTHRPIPKQLSNKLAREMSELFPRRLHIDTENDLLSLEFTSEWIDCVCQYTIGIAASLSGDLQYAEDLFLSLCGNSKLQQASLPPFKKMRQRVPVRLGEIYAFRASQVYENWRLSRSGELLDEMWTHLTRLRNFYPDHYAGRLLAAIYLFASRRDIDGAIREVKKCRTVRDGTWRYSYAFLLGYGGKLLKARRMYFSAFRHHCGRPDVAIQTEEFMLWVLQVEHDKAQLHFCLGLVNWKAKSDKALAKEHFNAFLQMTSREEYPECHRLATAYVSTIVGELKNEERETNQTFPKNQSGIKISSVQ